MRGVSSEAIIEANKAIVTHSSVLSLIIIAFCLLSLSCQPKPQKLTEVPGDTAAETVSIPPTVTQIDVSGLKELLKPNGKPRLINFWATWCGPCREEFPDLVKIGTSYKDKVDLITVSLDDVSEINSEVPEFLAQMKSASPAYLLKTPDESSAIALVSKDWQGALPFTILLNEAGATVYSKQGKFKTDILIAAIEKL